MFYLYLSVHCIVGERVFQSSKRTACCWLLGVFLNLNRNSLFVCIIIPASQKRVCNLNLTLLLFFSHLSPTQHAHTIWGRAELFGYCGFCVPLGKSALQCTHIILFFFLKTRTHTSVTYKYRAWLKLSSPHSRGNQHTRSPHWPLVVISGYCRGIIALLEITVKLALLSNPKCWVYAEN